ncbi:MAG TPA: iron-sulfur cluster assembly protein, partial [Rugosimonospora sp.]|nr:iron-sulfur cluster assembly protein [Rugosimonospora sp.]
MSAPTAVLDERLLAALATVNDPEIRRPITDLGMVAAAELGTDGAARVSVLLTVAGCPMRETLRDDVTAAAMRVPGVARVEISFGVMSDEQRRGLQTSLRGGHGAEPV